MLTGITLVGLISFSGCAGSRFSFIESEDLREAVRYDLLQEKERRERIHPYCENTCYPLKFAVYEF